MRVLWLEQPSLDLLKRVNWCRHLHQSHHRPVDLPHKCQERPDVPQMVHGGVLKN